MRHALLLTVLLAAATLSPQADPAASPPSLPAGRVSFDDGWRFFRGEATGAERPGFDDSRWRALDLPHDWAIEGPFAESNGPSQGGLPFFGTGWYRKRFTVPQSGPDRRTWIEFDGAMANSTVWLNGQELGGRPYGYIGFGFDLTPHLRRDGEENVLAVRLAPEPESSRWYPGAGLYRHVWLETTSAVHVARWSTVVTTPRVAETEALVNIVADVRNDGATSRTVRTHVEVVDPEGRVVARTDRASSTLGAGGVSSVAAAVPVTGPTRWTLERPALYQAVVVVEDDTTVIQRQATRFGIRSLSFSPTSGFALNGRRAPFKGVCLHHDLGALGTAVNRAAIARQLRIMRQMGVNAIRTSHNPPAPELLDLADEMGFLVIDEAFDMWGRTKVPNGHGKYFAEWGERDLRDMIRRDRNHPSVILWSIGNEILEQNEPAGATIAVRLKAICREEDPTRLVTAGLNQLDNAIRNGLAAAVDVVGFNYQARHYERVLKDHPGWMIFAAESASTVSSRGVYHVPLEKYQKHPSHQISSYDIIAPPWAYAPDAEFAAQDRLPQVLGEFVWTGIDYLGEPTPYYGWGEPADPNDWPARSSYFGIVDLAGFPKDRYYLYQSRWTDTPMVHLLPHWTWPGREGHTIPVMAYTNAQDVELFLDGMSLGRKTKGKDLTRIPVGRSVNDDGYLDSPYRLSWNVPYRPGTLRAIAYRDGAEVARTEVRTAGPPARLRVETDRSTLAAGGNDLAFVTVRVEDASGTLCPTADTTIRFTVTGAGSIVAVDNGDPATTAPFQGTERAAFNGFALAVVRAARAGGVIELTATADGLAAGSTRVVVQ
jgi:beta-galactosidase